MRVCDLSQRQLHEALAEGLRLRTGPFVSSIRSRMPAVLESLRLHYAAHEVAAAETFCDFHVGVDLPRGLRRWIRPQARFSFDGDLPFAPLPATQSFPLLEWGLNWCIGTHAHQFVTLHAAVLERNGKALVMPAPSGSGKSTLCAALAFSGWRLLSDELALLSLDGTSVTPLVRPISLKNQSIDLIRSLSPRAEIGAPVSDTVKGTVAHCSPPPDAVYRAAETAVPGWIVLPKYSAGAATALEPHPKAQAMMQLVDCCFNYSVHREGGFRALARWVTESECMRFEYSRLDEAVAAFDRLAGASST